MRSRFHYQVHYLQVLAEAGLIDFPNACFEFADEGPEEAQHGTHSNLPKTFASRLHGLPEVCCYGVLRVVVSLSPLFATIFSTPRPAHQPCAPRGCLKRDASSAAVESMK